MSDYIKETYKCNTFLKLKKMNMDQKEDSEDCKCTKKHNLHDQPYFEKTPNTSNKKPLPR